MPAYNTAPFIADAVSSALEQSFRDFELLILDDGSTDETLKIAERFAAKDCRIRVLRNDKRCGTACGRKRLIEEATGSWIAFLDSDDIWKEKKLELQRKDLLAHPETGLSFTASIFMNETGKRDSFVLHVPETVTYGELLKQNVIPCSSVLCRKELLKDIDADERVHEDYVTWLTASRRTVLRGLDLPLLVYRIRMGSRSSNRWKALWMTYRCYRKMEYSVFSSLAFLSVNVFRTLKKYAQIKEI